MRIQFAAFLIAAFGLILSDSQSQAGLLKNSVRLGDRTKMTIVRKPVPGQQKRIFNTEPGPPQEDRVAPVPEAPPEGDVGTLAWFWEAHGVEADFASAGRWTDGLTSLRVRRDAGLWLYSETRLRKVARDYGSEINAAARAHKVSQILLAAVIAVESGGRPDAISPKGARGLMQLIPATARRFGVANSYDAGENIMGGAAYLSWLLNNFDEDPILALAGYNAGEGAVQKHKGVPPYSETRDYVVRVFDALSAAEALCTQRAVTPRHRCLLPTDLATPNS